MSHIVHDGPLIIGAGLAGLSVALETAPRRTLLISPSPLLQGASSAWAQGGLAAAVASGDSPALHAADTALAGAGLVEIEAARVLTEVGAATVAWLAALGAPFDRGPDGAFAVSLEAAHSLARVVRVGGDGAGRAILMTVAAAVRAAPHVETWEDGRLVGLIQEGSGRVRGAVIERRGRRLEVLATSVVLATGGVGGLYAVTTNPSALKGEGMAVAALAGAGILDPEFVQFHPTAIDIGLDPAPLATEALRGEGARLVDREGLPLLADHPQGDLAPRDVVARAVHAARVEGRGAWLDAREAVGRHFPQAFPAVFAACMRAGIDPRLQPIPVAPAAHYHMGGIEADADGRTSLPGLFAVGECAATGVHGANRLASNSLLEAAAFGRRVGAAVAELESVKGRVHRSPARPPELSPEALAELRVGMSAHAGVVREETGLSGLVDLIDGLHGQSPGSLPLVAARLIAEAALERRESRGGHCRSDYPETDIVARHSRPARDRSHHAIAAE